jgi:asparagine synthase (glutamine-hydrolysing)
MLAVPAIPWARDKYLLRRAMAGVLPSPLLCRPKSPLSGDPQWEAARCHGRAPLLPEPGLGKYVNPVRLPSQADQDMMSFRANLSPRALNYWLRNLQSEGHDPKVLWPQSECISRIDCGQKRKNTLKAAS